MGWTRRAFAETFQRMLRDRYVEIGETVRTLRENQGLSQEALASAAGVSAKTVSRIESPPKTGAHAIRGSTFRKLAGVLGTTVEELRAPLTRGGTITVGGPTRSAQDADRSTADQMRREDDDDEGQAEAGGQQ